MVRIVEVLPQLLLARRDRHPGLFNDMVPNLIEVSDAMLLVANMDIPNIRNVVIGLQTLRLPQHPHVQSSASCSTRPTSKVKLEGEVEGLQVGADSLIPMTWSCPGKPGVSVILSAPGPAVSRALERLADTFIRPRRAPLATTRRNPEEDRCRSHKRLSYSRWQAPGVGPTGTSAVTRYWTGCATRSTTS